MKLSKRMEKILEMVPKCNSVADIGTDHGYIAIELLERGICKKVIATDVNTGPLEKARMNATFRGYEYKVDFRLGSGLKVLKKHEVDGVIIAGMGGDLMVDILKISSDIVKSLKFILLQPIQNPEAIRRFVYDKHFTIIKEDMVREEDGRFYEFIKVQYDENVLGFSHREEDFEISPILVKNRNPYLRDWLIEKIKEAQIIRSKLDLNFASSRLKDSELERKIEIYGETLKWL